MAINQSQNTSKSQTSQSSTASKPQTHSASSSSQSSHEAPSSMPPSSTASKSSSMNEGNSSGDMIEQTIAKGVSSLMQTLEPQLNRIAGQIVNRAMSRGQNFADTGVKRMQEQPWYMVGGALALVAVGVGLLFAFDAEPTADFSKNNIQ